MRNPSIRKAAFLTAALFTVAVVFATPVQGKETYEEKFEKTIALAADGKVHISNVSGDIEVRTWGEAQVKIQALKVSKASSSAKAKENAQKVEIEINEEAKFLRIETKYPKDKKFRGGDSINVSVDYWLWIPGKAAIKASTVSGDVDVEGLGGSAELSAVSGNVDVRKALNGADCNAVSGDLTLSDIQGDVYLRTVSGGIKVKRIKGSINGETVSGDLEMTEVSDASTVRGKVLSGEILYRGSINRNGTYNLKAHSGEVEMILPADSAFDFEAETFSGTIDLDFEVQVSGKISPKEIRGVVNGGGASVNLASFSGNIKLKKG